MAKKRFYVVWSGLNPGIYNSWDECQEQIKGVKQALYKSFDTLEDAVAARNILIKNNWDVDKVPESLYSWRFFTEYNPLTHTWEISNLIGDDIVSFGFFKSIPIAKKALGILIENNWDSSHIPLEYYYEDSNIRPFKRSKETYYGVVRRINFELVTIASFEDKRDAIAFRDSLFLNNWSLEEEEQQFDNFIFIRTYCQNCNA